MDGKKLAQGLEIGLLRRVKRVRAFVDVLREMLEREFFPAPFVLRHWADNQLNLLTVAIQHVQSLAYVVTHCHQLATTTRAEYTILSWAKSSKCSPVALDQGWLDTQLALSNELSRLLNATKKSASRYSHNVSTRVVPEVAGQLRQIQEYVNDIFRVLEIWADLLENRVGRPTAAEIRVRFILLESTSRTLWSTFLEAERIVKRGQDLLSICIQTRMAAAAGMFALALDFDKVEGIRDVVGRLQLLHNDALGAFHKMAESNLGTDRRGTDRRSTDRRSTDRRGTERRSTERRGTERRGTDNPLFTLAKDSIQWRKDELLNHTDQNLPDLQQDSSDAASIPIVCSITADLDWTENGNWFEPKVNGTKRVLHTFNSLLASQLFGGSDDQGEERKSVLVAKVQLTSISKRRIKWSKRRAELTITDDVRNVDVHWLGALKSVGIRCLAGQADEDLQSLLEQEIELRRLRAIRSLAISNLRIKTTELLDREKLDRVKQLESINHFVCSIEREPDSSILPANPWHVFQENSFPNLVVTVDGTLSREERNLARTLLAICDLHNTDHESLVKLSGLNPVAFSWRAKLPADYIDLVMRHGLTRDTLLAQLGVQFRRASTSDLRASSSHVVPLGAKTYLSQKDLGNAQLQKAAEKTKGAKSRLGKTRIAKARTDKPASASLQAKPASARGATGRKD